jgi:hypothetical protein
MIQQLVLFARVKGLLEILVFQKCKQLLNMKNIGIEFQIFIWLLQASWEQQGRIHNAMAYVF